MGTATDKCMFLSLQLQSCWIYVDFTNFFAPFRCVPMCNVNRRLTWHCEQDGELLVGEAAKWILDLKEISLTCRLDVNVWRLTCSVATLKTGFCKMFATQGHSAHWPWKLCSLVRCRNSWRHGKTVCFGKISLIYLFYLILLSKVAGPKRFLGRTWSELTAKQMCLAAPLKAQIVSEC